MSVIFVVLSVSKKFIQCDIALRAASVISQKRDKPMSISRPYRAIAARHKKKTLRHYTCAHFLKLNVILNIHRHSEDFHSK
eukprot:UN10365